MKMKQKTLIPEIPVMTPPPAPTEVPRDLTFEKMPGVVLKENAILYMTKQFNEENCMPLTRAITEYNLMPKDKQPEVIHLHINSPGGEVYHALQLIDTIKQSRIPVWTYNLGIAASCGCLLLMSGHKRFATKYSQTMSHVFSGGSGGKEFDLYSRVNSLKMTSKFMEEHYKEHTGHSLAYVRKYLLPPEDVWLSAEGALKYNIIDEIIDTNQRPVPQEWKQSKNKKSKKKNKKS
ncbi:MAG: ATP-dependent Clp protease proteolytic subunit [Candidatus Thiodiazotropha taylori]|uniref:ATP-dependent Clp protease proteolytic subunit n=1 Tax=Candidatus Thiodiazotropha taylori TaxID=2792791 RepID=A0A9E4K8H5_9GAMM|nr:ATP-dependent Clp protease proteolytic subunit [Candidatus Thiodiazotropha taylori]MCW4254941.1 ATP-dependent Clp protease proteolytic subunit [Candidatus Thiodiazotropha taylori]